MADWIINRPKATITCSKCKAKLNAKLFMDLLEKWNYCPYCGADMRAEQTEPICENCKWAEVEWADEPCENCCKNNSGFEPKQTEPITNCDIDCSWK